MLEVLKPIFIEVFKNSTVELTEETVASDIHGWDSLGHLRLMMAFEWRWNARDVPMY
jgi:acyl carrier protein